MSRRVVTWRSAGFTLVELMVVIGIIALLIALLMPALTKANHHAQQIRCVSNLRQVGILLTIYSQDNDGWYFPVGAWDPVQKKYKTYGYESSNPTAPRWTVFVWQPPETYPAVMRCPSDFQPADNHSYILNQHLAESPDKLIKFFSNAPQGKSKDQVVLMGEKVSTEPDWYMEADRDTGMLDFYRLVELYRPGPNYGSNYLYADMHASSLAPSKNANAIDPWDIYPSETPPTPPP